MCVCTYVCMYVCMYVSIVVYIPPPPASSSSSPRYRPDRPTRMLTFRAETQMLYHQGLGDRQMSCVCVHMYLYMQSRQMWVHKFSLRNQGWQRFLQRPYSVFQKQLPIFRNAPLDAGTNPVSHAENCFGFWQGRQLAAAEQKLARHICPKPQQHKAPLCLATQGLKALVQTNLEP